MAARPGHLTKILNSYTACNNVLRQIIHFINLFSGVDIPHSLTDDAIAKKDGLSLEGPAGGKKVHTHTFTNFPDPHESEDDEEDKSDVIFSFQSV